MNTVKATCKKCNGQADADKFQLDFYSRMVVCPPCYNKRGKKEKVVEAKKPVVIRPRGWDKEDELIEKLTREKKARISNETRGRIERVPGMMHVKYTCPQCSFKFKYHPLERRPRTCPYCNEKNPIIKVTGIL